MFKKVVALLLTLALGFSFIPQAQAARLENPIFLSPMALTTDDNVWREFSNGSTVNIVMAPDEWMFTPAFHAVDGWVLSYSDLNAISSDPNVAEAKTTYVGASPVNGVANSFIGLEIHAKNPGTAVITVDYGTFVTNSQYTDQRSTPYANKTFVVTVMNNALEMDVSLSANEVVLDWSAESQDAAENYTQGMKDVTEELSSNMMSSGLTAMITGGAMLAGMGVAVALGVAAGALFVPVGALAMAGMAVGMATSLAVNTSMNQAKGSTTPISAEEVSEVAKDALLEQGLQGIPGLKEMVDIAETAYKAADADLNNELRKYPHPANNPAEVTAYVRLTNNSSFDIHDVTLSFSSVNLSFASSKGPWGVIQQPITVPANSTIVCEEILIPPDHYHYEESGVLKLMYTGTVLVECSYHDLNTGTDVVLNGEAELSGYSKLNIDDMPIVYSSPTTVIQASYQHLASGAGHMRVSYIMCPVDVMILDKAGNTLATLTTNGEPYQDEYILAGSHGDMKYFMVPYDKKDDYQLKIIAVEDGEMSIVGADCSDATNMTIYESIQLIKGDTFTLDLTEPVAATLYALKADGASEKIKATLTLNEEYIATVLEQTDVSEENRTKVAHAIARSLVPMEVLGGSFQEAITLEKASMLMLNLFEKQLGMLPGDLTDMYLAANTEATPISVPVAVAAWNGLLDIEYHNVATAEDAATRPLTSNEVLMMLNNFRDIMQWTSDFSCQIEPLTIEQMICLVDAMWEVLSAQGKDVALAAKLTEEVLGEMVSKAVPDSAVVLYYREGETLKSVLRNSMIYFPTIIEATVTADQAADDLSTILTIYDTFQLAEIHPGTVVDFSNLRQHDYNIVSGTIGNGIALTDGRGWDYTWYPFYFTVQNGKIYKDTVYLAIFRGKNGADDALLAEYGYENEGDNRMECYIVADQDRVGSFLAEQYLLDQLMTTSQYKDLKRGSEGNDVIMLQQALINNGWLSTEANGVYDKQTQNAVHSLQKQLGLKTTGIADINLQKILYGEMTVQDIALETWLAPYVKQAERKASSYDTTQMVKILSNANIRAEANADSKRIGSAKSGETYICLGVEDNGWYRLQMDDGSEGFISGNLAEIID